MLTDCGVVIVVLPFEAAIACAAAAPLSPSNANAPSVGIDSLILTS